MGNKEILTDAEKKVIDHLADAWNLFVREVIFDGDTALEDQTEFMQHIHALQNMMLSQAARRYYPQQYRLLGDVIKENSMNKDVFHVVDDGPLVMPIGQGIRCMTEKEQNEYYKNFNEEEVEEFTEPKFTLGGSNQKTYRKLPVEVQGLQWTGTNVHEMREFVGRKDKSANSNAEWKFLTPAEISGVMESSAIVYDDVQGGWISVNLNDTILCGVSGEFYPISADVLSKTYEQVR